MDGYLDASFDSVRGRARDVFISARTCCVVYYYYRVSMVPLAAIFYDRVGAAPLVSVDGAGSNVKNGAVLQCHGNLQGGPRQQGKREARGRTNMSSFRITNKTNC